MEIFNSKKQNSDYLKLVEEIRDTYSGLTISAFIIDGLKKQYVDDNDLSNLLIIISQSHSLDESYTETAISFLARLNKIRDGIDAVDVD